MHAGPRAEMLTQLQGAADVGARHQIRTGAAWVASANIGCTLQLRRHLGDRARVQHPMELLAASAGLHPLPGLPQGAGNAEIAGEGEDRQSAAGPR